MLTVGGVAALGGNDDDGDGDDAAAEVEDGAGAGGAAATPCPDPGTPAVCIDEVVIQDGAVLASFSTQDVTLTEPVGGRFPDGTFHAVFFFDQIDPAEGRVWGPGSPFGNPEADLPGLSADQAPSSTRALCALIQDDNGNIFSGTGNCAPLPEHT